MPRGFPTPEIAQLWMITVIGTFSSLWWSFPAVRDAQSDGLTHLTSDVQLSQHHCTDTSGRLLRHEWEQNRQHNHILAEDRTGPFVLKAIFTRSEYQVIYLFLSLWFKRQKGKRQSRVDGKKFGGSTTMTLLTWWCVLCKWHSTTKEGNYKWWLNFHNPSQKMAEISTHRVNAERRTSAPTHIYTQVSSSWGALLLQKPVKLGDCGISIVCFVLARSIWGNSSMCSIFSSARVCLRSSVNMMYEAVCRGWAKKNGALHHLTSHCQTQPRHYTSQKYQAHPCLSNFAICWQCLHGGWFVITNSRAKINKLIYDPSCICTMKMPLVM